MRRDDSETEYIYTVPGGHWYYSKCTGMPLPLATVRLNAHSNMTTVSQRSRFALLIGTAARSASTRCRTARSAVSFHAADLDFNRFLSFTRHAVTPAWTTRRGITVSLEGAAHAMLRLRMCEVPGDHGCLTRCRSSGSVGETVGGGVGARSAASANRDALKFTPAGAGAAGEPVAVAVAVAVPVSEPLPLHSESWPRVMVDGEHQTVGQRPSAIDII